MDKIAVRYMVGMFSYGFLRGIRSEYKQPDDLIGKRIGYSFMNGLFYAAIPPYGLLRLSDIANRADVYFSGKDPEKYESIYSEVSGTGKNKHILF